jgi:hypothetical protein
MTPKTQQDYVSRQIPAILIRVWFLSVIDVSRRILKVDVGRGHLSGSAMLWEVTQDWGVLREVGVRKHTPYLQTKIN